MTWPMQLSATGERLREALRVIDLPALKAQLALLENDASQGSVWEDAARAQALLTKINTLKWVCRGLCAACC